MTPEMSMTLAIQQAKLQNDSPKRGFILASEGQILASGCPLQRPLPEIKKATQLFLNLPWEENEQLWSWIAPLSQVDLFFATPYPAAPFPRVPLALQEKISLTVGTSAQEAYLLNKIFFKKHIEKQPYVLAKWAMTWDGKIATRKKQSQWISNEESRKHTHTLRGEYQAILVGIGTVLADDPLLTCRNGGQNPVRVILDRHLQLPLSSKICQTASDVLTYVFCLDTVSIGKIKPYEALSLKVFPCEAVSLQGVLSVLFQNHLFSVLIEGGGTLLESAFQENIVDELCVFLGPKIFGGSVALTPVEGEGVGEVSEAWLLEAISCEQKGTDIWLQGYCGLTQKIQKLISFAE